MKNSINEMKAKAQRLEQAIVECEAMGWGATKTFYQFRLENLNGEIARLETFIANSAKTKGLPLPRTTF